MAGIEKLWMLEFPAMKRRALFAILLGAIAVHLYRTPEYYLAENARIITTTYKGRILCTRRM
jgi:hypothetical protein